MRSGTRVLIKSLNVRGTIEYPDGFPYGRVPTSWMFVQIDKYDHPFRTGEFFDPKDLEVIEEVPEPEAR